MKNKDWHNGIHFIRIRSKYERLKLSLTLNVQNLHCTKPAQCKSITIFIMSISLLCSHKIILFFSFAQVYIIFHNMYVLVWKLIGRN